MLLYQIQARSSTGGKAIVPASFPLPTAIAALLTFFGQGWCKMGLAVSKLLEQLFRRSYGTVHDDSA